MMPTRFRQDDFGEEIQWTQRRRRSCLSPQCGFSSNYLGNPVTIEDEKRKLALVVDVAHSVWGTA